MGVFVFVYTTSGRDVIFESGKRYLILSANKVRTKYAIAMICLMIQGFGLDDLKVENSKM